MQRGYLIGLLLKGLSLRAGIGDARRLRQFGQLLVQMYDLKVERLRFQEPFKIIHLRLHMLTTPSQYGISPTIPLKTDGFGIVPVLGLVDEHDDITGHACLRNCVRQNRH